MNQPACKLQFAMQTLACNVNRLMVNIEEQYQYQLLVKSRLFMLEKVIRTGWKKRFQFEECINIKKKNLVLISDKTKS